MLLHCQLKQTIPESNHYVYYIAMADLCSTGSRPHLGRAAVGLWKKACSYLGGLICDFIHGVGGRPGAARDSADRDRDGAGNFSTLILDYAAWQQW